MRTEFRGFQIYSDLGKPCDCQADFANRNYILSSNKAAECVQSILLKQLTGISDNEAGEHMQSTPNKLLLSQDRHN